MRTTSKALLAIPAAFALALTSPAAAMAAETYQIDLEELSDSGATGTASLTLEDNGDLRVRIESSGLVPNQPHAQHIHGDADLDKDYFCPGPERDTDGDGIISTVEGLPDYGGIFVSLTTEGDTSADSGLAVDRMPVADENGDVTYERTIGADELPADFAAAVPNLHVVQHGIDVNGNGEYDFDAGPSTLEPSLPLEATAPANCGMVEGANIQDMPAGGVETGTATTGSGPASFGLMALGGLALAGAGAVAVRRTRLGEDA